MRGGRDSHFAAKRSRGVFGVLDLPIAALNPSCIEEARVPTVIEDIAA